MSHHHRRRSHALQLGDLFARYMPARLGQFDRKIAEFSAIIVSAQAIVPDPVYPNDPNEIVREALL